MLQKTRELLVLALIAVLPFHALLVTAGTRLLAGVGRAPMPALALWKEAILGLVLCIALAEALLLWRRNYQYTSILITPTDVLDWLIIGLLVLGVSVSATHYSLLTTHFFFGFKYTLFPLFLFLILRRVPWSERSFQLSLRPRAQGRVAAFSFQVTGTLVAVYGILTLFLPGQFFAWLGYSDLHSTYLPDGPLAAFQYLEGTGIRRMQATFAGPNQLGMWLLIPWSVVVMTLVRRLGSVMVSPSNHGTRVSHFDGLSVTRWAFPIVIIGIALFLTFSRAAWIGAVVILLAALMRQVSPRARCRLLIAGCSFLAILLLVTAVLRPRSTMEHLRRPLQALQIIVQHPFGLGLGSVGPAANRTGDACIFLEEGADASWAADRPNLCVFVGDRQVQPFDSAPVRGPEPLRAEWQGKPIPCRCPFLPENWYLQVGVELGVVGLILYVVLVVYVLRSLWAGSGQRAAGSMYALAASRLPLAAFLFFLGISVAALFLHAWEDSAVAYTVWILVATALPPPHSPSPRACPPEPWRRWGRGLG